MNTSDKNGDNLNVLVLHLHSKENYFNFRKSQMIINKHHKCIRKIIK